MTDPVQPPSDEPLSDHDLTGMDMLLSDPDFDRIGVLSNDDARKLVVEVRRLRAENADMLASLVELAPLRVSAPTPDHDAAARVLWDCLYSVPFEDDDEQVYDWAREVLTAALSAAPVEYQWGVRDRYGFEAWIGEEANAHRIARVNWGSQLIRRTKAGPVEVVTDA